LSPALRHFVSYRVRLELPREAVLIVIGYVE